MVAAVSKSNATQQSVFSIESFAISAITGLDVACKCASCIATDLQEAFSGSGFARALPSGFVLSFFRLPTCICRWGQAC